MEPALPFVGRSRELAAAERALDRLQQGVGSTLCVVGAAGFGKSTLLDRIGDLARARGLRVLRGASAEVGGAPPWWPWVQALRRTELGDVFARTEVAPDAAAARFALLDHVTTGIESLAPVVVVLDDLHRADLPTLELLRFATRARGRVLWVPAWRTPEPDDARPALLGAVLRDAVVLPLGPLERDAVAEWVARVGAVRDPDEVMARSEGVPLYVRAALSGSGEGPALLAEPLARLSAEDRRVLEVAAVIGRDIDEPLMTEVVGHPVRDALSAGARCGLLDGGQFAHVLLRDLLYEGLAPHDRRALHRAVGDRLLARGGAVAAAAHHLLEGAAADTLEHAVDVARRAAGEATSAHAPEAAASMLERVRDLLDAHRVPPARLAEAGVALARALHAAGLGDRARAASARAAEDARRGALPELLAEAALTYAEEIRSGLRDPVMIALLEEALAANPAATPLRARVLVRLGAALTPAPDPVDRRGYELAEEALGLADALGDDDTTLYVLQWAAPAKGYHATDREIADLKERAAEQGRRLGRELEVIEAVLGAVVAPLCRGERVLVERRLAAATELLARWPQPPYRWRLPALRAGLDALSGDFDTALTHIDEVAEIARSYEMPRLEMIVMFLALAWSHASGRPLDRHRDTLERGVARLGPAGRPIRAWLAAHEGRLDEARRVLAGCAIERPALIVTLFHAETLLLLEDASAARAALGPLVPAVARIPLAYGPGPGAMFGPLPALVGDLAWLAGDRALSAELHRRALDLAERIGAGPGMARARRGLARAEGSSPAVAAAPPTLAITRGGGLATVTFRGRVSALADAKGFAYLEALVGRPGAEVLAIELAGVDDRGDAGEVLDAAARRAYRDRLEALADDLDEATRHGDTWRATRLQAEIDALVDQLAAGVGLGGRGRRAAAPAERARINVQRRIRDAVRKLAAVDADAARYLDATVRTGTTCRYQPV